MHLGVSYVRKGILLDVLNQQDSAKWYEKGFDILETAENETLVKELKKEIELYSI